MSTDKIPAGMAIASSEHARIQTMPMDSGWQRRHIEAFESWRGRSKVGSIMLTHIGSNSSPTIGEDYVLGPEWAAIGRGLLGLLNGETGRFDCGTLDAILANALDAEGFDRYAGRKVSK